MKFAYEFQHLCGTVYTQGKVVFTPDGNTLLSPVGNRISMFDLVHHTCRTFPFESRSDVSLLAVSPDSRLLLAVDLEGRCLLIHLQRGVILYRFNFKHEVSQMEFSPDGQFVAVALGKKIQLWHTPGHTREFAPFVHHRTYMGHYGDICSLAWSPDSKFFISGASDLTAKVWSVAKIPGLRTMTLAGHRDAVVGAYFDAANMLRITTVGRDGGVYLWEGQKLELVQVEGGEGGKSADSDSSDSSESEDSESEDLENAPPQDPNEQRHAETFNSTTTTTTTKPAIGGPVKWSTVAKHVLKMNFASITCCTYHPQCNMLIVGFSNGTFGLYEIHRNDASNDLVNVHTLSISQHQIASVAVNPSGDWLAFASRELGQLLVWEWQSETYVFKQQGHYFDVNTLAYSGDGQILATGADDAKIKLWSTTSGYCYATLSEHVAPVTAVVFHGSNLLVSASLDGTVRCYDTSRYSNFRVLTSPTPVQFHSLAVDSSGQLVAAGTMEPYQIYLWSVQSGKVLDVLTGHTAPVTSLAFHDATLVSGSWDHSVRLWQVYASGNQRQLIEPLGHSHDVVALAIRPDGKELCSATLNGQLNFWNMDTGELTGSIEGRRDIAGGRLDSDRISASQKNLTAYFTSVCYSANGQCVIAGGESKYVCIYEVAHQLLVKKFQLSANRSLQGILDRLNSAQMTEIGVPLAELPSGKSKGKKVHHSEEHDLSGAKRGVDPGARREALVMRSKAVAFSPTGRTWACATSEGLMIYSLNENMLFDPVELDVNITPESICETVQVKKEFGKALLMSLHLNEQRWIQHVVEHIPLESIELVVESALVGGTVSNMQYINRLLEFLALKLESSCHIEYYLHWSLTLLRTHGSTLQRHSRESLATFRSLQKSLSVHLQDLSQLCNDNQYTLDFLHRFQKPQEPEAEAMQDRDMMVDE